MALHRIQEQENKHKRSQQQTSGQEHIPGEQGGALLVALALALGADVLSTIESAAGVSQAHVHGQHLHDAGRGQLAVDGVEDDGRAKSLNGGLLHAPVGEVALGLVLEELVALLGVQEAGNVDNVDLVLLGETLSDLFSGPAGVVDTGGQGTVGAGGDFTTALQELLEVLELGGVHGATAVPTNSGASVDFCLNGKNSQGGKSSAGSEASRDALQHESEADTSLKNLATG